MTVGLRPPDAPRAMPVQSFRQWVRPTRQPPHVPRILLRRILVLGGALALAGLATYEVFRVLVFRGLTGLELVLLILFATLVPWIALSLTNALAGAWAQLTTRKGKVEPAPTGPTPPLRELTALLIPTHNEEPARIVANIEAITTSLAETGELAHFHVVVLSDSTDADAWIAEEEAILHLRDRLDGAAWIFYRHRPKNVDLKAGNVADWVRRFGAPYAHFVVLDADSLMEGETLVRLAATMERQPHVGVIQTIPIVVGGVTLFARLQQFANRVYGPLIANGLAWWNGADGNYWGHNAIVRTVAFAEAAGLPHLKGPKPFGGHVLSHDFVEAALVRRGGWAVRLAPALSGSYEESPPSIVDLATRDRRWCQGNLQHLAVVTARGLRPVSRLHFVTGVFAYLASPLWLAFLVVGMLVSLQARFVTSEPVTSGFRLLGMPAQDFLRARRLFLIMMAVLLAPKFIALALLLTKRHLRRGCGGAARASVSVALESLTSALIAPIMMLVQSRAVTAVALGRDVGWKVQRRGGVISSREIIRRHLWHTVFGVTMALAAWLVSPSLFIWMIPIAIGLVLAIPISAVTAQPRAGRLAWRAGFFRTPEESMPPPVLATATSAMAAVPEGEAIARLAEDPRLFAVHRVDLPPPRHPGEPIDADLLVARVTLDEAASIDGALQNLTVHQKVVALNDLAALTCAVELRRLSLLGRHRPGSETAAARIGG